MGEGLTFFITSAIWFFICLFCAGYVHECTWKNSNKKYEKIAIEKGYGKRIMIDSITGETKFFWADSLPKE